MTVEPLTQDRALILNSLDIAPGTSILARPNGHAPGVLGALVWNTVTRRVFGLTCRHTAAYHDTVWHKGKIIGNVIHSFDRAEPDAGAFPATRQVSDLLALVELAEDCTLDLDKLPKVAPAAMTSTEALGCTVQRIGPNSSEASGRVIATGYSFTMALREKMGSTQFRGSLLIESDSKQPFSSYGDVGAAVTTPTGRLVGLVVGGHDRHSIVMPLSAALRRHNLHPLTRIIASSHNINAWATREVYTEVLGRCFAHPEKWAETLGEAIGSLDKAYRRHERDLSEAEALTKFLDEFLRPLVHHVVSQPAFDRALKGGEGEKARQGLEGFVYFTTYLPPEEQPVWLKTHVNGMAEPTGELTDEPGPEAEIIPFPNRVSADISVLAEDALGASAIGDGR